MNIYRGRSHTEVYLASVLYDSIEDKDISSVKRLLEEKKADPNLVLPRKGISSFHLIIGNDSEDFAMEVTSLIIQNGGNPNVPSDDGLTPVHIAAAWGRIGILKLLLNCGGDPELTDNCYKTALHYSIDEGWKEVTTLIKDYINFQRCAIYNNCDAKVPCTIILDKVLLNNGQLVGEYEVQKLENNDAMPQMDLKSLPQTDSQEYVLSWCNNQELDYNSTEEYSAELECCGNTAFIGSRSNSHLSKDSSIKSNYRSKSSSSLNQNSIPSVSSNRKNSKERFNNITIRNKSKLYTNIISRDICKYKESSRESGILTLQDSSENDSNDSNSEYSDSDVEKENYICNSSKCIKGLENLNIKENKDTSSDYCTCTEDSQTANPLDKTVYDAPKSNTVNSNSTTSDDQDISFVSVSEVYKYTDTEEGVVLYEKRVLVASINSSQNESNSTQSSLPKSFDYDTDTLKKELTTQGFDPGPITKTTKRVYLRKLYQLKKHQQITEIKSTDSEKVYSPELQHTLTDFNWYLNLSQFQYLEDLIRKQFSNPDPSRKWREGISKSSFTYLLLDPRITKNLPHRCDKLQKKEVWETFLSSIFYVGKGKRNRPFSHLYAAINNHNKLGVNTDNKKINRILDIWRDNHGVICLHVFQNVIPVEAYTREAAMISSLNLDNITNSKVGDFYGVTATWTRKQRNLLGVYLLYKSMKIFLHEGERQLFPNDIE